MHVLSSGMVGAPSRDANGRVWALPHCPVCWCVAVLCGGTLYVCAILDLVQKEERRGLFVPFFSGFGRLSRVP